jgi:hypothetical protein
MGVQAARGLELTDLARFHFGGWYEAVAAAGLKPEGRPQPGKGPGPRRGRLRPLTEELLRGPRSSLELEEITGVRATLVRERRESRGIVREEQRKKDRSWLPAVRKLLGNAPDTEIAQKAGVSPGLIARARVEP